MSVLARLRDDPLLQTLLHTGKRDVPVTVALRNTAAIVLPLLVGALTGHLFAGLGISVGALNTMFADQPGPYRLRLRRMLLTAAAAGAAAFAGAVLGQWPMALLLAAALWGFGAALLVAVDAHLTRVGLTSMILLLVLGAEPQTPLQAVPEALLIFAGGLLQTLFAIAAWPLQRYRPERLALAQGFRGLADFARTDAAKDIAVALPPSLNDLQALLFGAGRARGSAVEAFRVLAEVSERIRLELFALASQQAACEQPEIRATLASARSAAADVLTTIASALEQANRRPPRSTRKSRMRAPPHWVGNCARPSATPTPPAAAARSGRCDRNSGCRARCNRTIRSSPCAPTCVSRRRLFGTRSAAALAWRLHWRWRTRCRCRAATGCR